LHVNIKYLILIFSIVIDLYLKDNVILAAEEKS